MSAILEQAQKLFKRNPNLNAKREDKIALIFFTCMYLIINPTAPSDDFWRHMVIHKYNYDFTNLYIYSYVPKINIYIGFDYIIGEIYKFMNLIYEGIGTYSFIIVQCLIVVFFGIGYIKATEGDEGHNLKLLFFMLLIYTIAGRISLARPCILFSSIFFLLWFWENRYARVIITTLIAPLYWLFFLYVIPLLIKERWVILSLLLGFVFWGLYGGDEYLIALKSIISVKNMNVVEDVTVGEGKNILFSFLMAYIFSFIPFVINMNFRKDYKTLFTMCFYSLSMQIRYMEIISPLAISYIRFIKQDIPKIVVILCLPLLFMGFYSVRSHGAYKPEYFEVLKNKRVFVASFDMINFKLSYTVYPVKISPAMEIRWADKDIQQMIIDVGKKGKLDCNLLNKYDFDYVVEYKLTEIPTCLTLEAIKGELRIWKVKKPLPS